MFDWIFSSVHSDHINDDVRTVYLSGLQKVLLSVPPPSLPPSLPPPLHLPPSPLSL